jgi:hypothetical protein
MGREECESFSRYLVKDILQNKGEVRYSPVMDYSAGLKSFPVRLIADKLGEKNQVLYELTKQGFDFLFRTKEVDDELGFEIETIRLRMLISKKNYKKAMQQSKYILQMLIEKRNELRQFEQQMRNDVFSVSGEQFDLVVKGVNAMLHEEYEAMREIEHMLEQAQIRLDEEAKLSSSPDEKTRAAQQEIIGISANVQRALGLQRSLLIQCNDVRTLYLSVLRDSLLFSQVKRFDVEEHLLKPMEGLAFTAIEGLSRFRAGLLAPLFLPDIKRSLNISMMYDRQAKLREAEEGSKAYREEETEADNWRLERISKRNDAHTRVIALLLEFAGSRASFTFDEFWAHIKEHRHIAEMASERLLFLDMLKLYEVRAIDLEKWHSEAGMETSPMDSMGEFDLDYCLARCMDADSSFYSVKRLSIEKAHGRVSCEVSPGEHVSIDNLQFEAGY